MEEGSDEEWWDSVEEISQPENPSESCIDPN